MRWRASLSRCYCSKTGLSFYRVNETGDVIIEATCCRCKRPIQPNQLDVTYTHQPPLESSGCYVIGIGDLLRNGPLSLRMGLPIQRGESFSIADPSEKCRILDLPDEILLQIVRHVVPLGTSFHIFPTRMAHVKARPLGTAVHTLRLRRSEASLCTDTLRDGDYTALARTCRRMKELCYSVVFGENHFTFEMATAGLNPRLEGEIPESGFDSRISILEHSPDTLWPLSSGCAEYLKELTLLVSITSKASYSSRTLLRERFQEMLKVFASGNSLKRVTLDVRKITELPFGPSQERLRWEISDSDEVVLRLAAVMPLQRDPAMYTTFRESLRELQHVEDLVLSAGPNSNVLEDLVGTPKAPTSNKKRRLR